MRELSLQLVASKLFFVDPVKNIETRNRMYLLKNIYIEAGFDKEIRITVNEQGNFEYV